MKKVLLLVALLCSLAGAEPETEYVPSAQEKDKPAVFGYMILASRASRLGSSIHSVNMASIYPWTLCVIFFAVSQAHRLRAKEVE